MAIFSNTQGERFTYSFFFIHGLFKCLICIIIELGEFFGNDVSISWGRQFGNKRKFQVSHLSLFLVYHLNSILFIHEEK